MSALPKLFKKFANIFCFEAGRRFSLLSIRPQDYVVKVKTLRNAELADPALESIGPLTKEDSVVFRRTSFSSDLHNLLVEPCVTGHAARANLLRYAFEMVVSSDAWTFTCMYAFFCRSRKIMYLTLEQSEA